jgi:hypothetical protein
MSFTFTNYAAIPTKPGPLGDIIGNILSGYTGVTQAKFLKPTLEEELKKAKLYNQYYAPNIESEIGLRGAQAGEAGARTGLLGEQTRAAHTENSWLPQKLQAAIAESQAKAQKAQMFQQMFGGGQAIRGNQGVQQNPMQMFQGQGMPANPDESNQMQNNQMSAQNQPSLIQQAAQPIPESEVNQNRIPGMDYSKAAAAMQYFGLGKPHIVDANGKFMAITPFGNFETGAAGLSARDKELSKKDAQKISGLEDQVLSGSQKQETFNDLNKDLGSNLFESMRQNPLLGAHELGWWAKLGTKEQQEMIGRVRSNMGNIIKDAARDFKGQFRVGEQGLLNSMKPNENDSLSVMKGKSEALTYMNQILTMRAEMEASLMRQNNISALQARIAVNKAIDPQKIKDEVHTILHPASSSESKITIRNKNTGKTESVTREEARKRGVDV